MARIVGSAFDAAIEVLRRNSVEGGLRASANYYNQVWARDSFISFQGANLLGDEKLLACARRNVLTFSKTASPLGQIANFLDLESKRPEYGYSGSTDSSSWYIIGLASLFRATGDRGLLRGPYDAAKDAYRWLRYQDANNAWLIDSPPGADWMDAAIQRAGKTLYNNALFLMANRCMESLASNLDAGLSYPAPDTRELEERFRDVFLPGNGSPARLEKYWPRLADGLRKGQLERPAPGYFLHYVSFHRMDLRFDTLSNLLCVLGGIAGAKASRTILETIRRRKLSDPFPVRVLDPPYTVEGASYDRSFDSSLPPQHRSRPYEYHNGAVWPFVGGVHVSTLYLKGDPSAARELENLARANFVFKKGERVGFNEWLHGKTGKPMGQFGQSWNAGMFIAASLAAKGKQPFRHD